MDNRIRFGLYQSCWNRRSVNLDCGDECGVCGVCGVGDVGGEWLDGWLGTWSGRV